MTSVISPDITRDKTVVVYHSFTPPLNCPDGLAASWAFEFWYLKNGGRTEDVTYLPSIANEDPADYETFRGKCVVILDMCYRREALFTLAGVAKSVLVLDHHKSAMNELAKGLPENVIAVLDMTRSGAQIAWDYWFPEHERPWFVDVIADRDLWKWELQGSKELGTYLSHNGFYNTRKTLSELLFWESNRIEASIKEGAEVLKNIEDQVAGIVAMATLNLFKAGDREYKLYLVECAREHRSEVGNRLSERDCDFAVMYHLDTKSSKWWLSCRSNRERRDVDLSAICKALGGGGHAQAAGFSLDGDKPLSTWFIPI